MKTDLHSAFPIVGLRLCFGPRCLMQTHRFTKLPTFFSLMQGIRKVSQKIVAKILYERWQLAESASWHGCDLHATTGSRPLYIAETTAPAGNYRSYGLHDDRRSKDKLIERSSNRMNPTWESH